jgi:hypothetical protein
MARRAAAAITVLWRQLLPATKMDTVGVYYSNEGPKLSIPAGYAKSHKNSRRESHQLPVAPFPLLLSARAKNRGPAVRHQNVPFMLENTSTDPEAPERPRISRLSARHRSRSLPLIGARLSQRDCHRGS